MMAYCEMFKYIVKCLIKWLIVEMYFEFSISCTGSIRTTQAIPKSTHKHTYTLYTAYDTWKYDCVVCSPHCECLFL